jgi:hypothetical protein
MSVKGKKKRGLIDWGLVYRVMSSMVDSSFVVVVVVGYISRALVVCVSVVSSVVFLSFFSTYSSQLRPFLLMCF